MFCRLWVWVYCTFVFYLCCNAQLLVIVFLFFACVIFGCFYFVFCWKKMQMMQFLRLITNSLLKHKFFTLYDIYLCQPFSLLLDEFMYVWLRNVAFVNAPFYFSLYICHLTLTWYCNVQRRMNSQMTSSAMSAFSTRCILWVFNKTSQFAS